MYDGLIEVGVLIIAGPHPDGGLAVTEPMAKLAEELTRLGHEVQWARSAQAARAFIRGEARYGAILLDWDLTEEDAASDRAAIDLLELGRSRNGHLPIYLMAATRLPDAVPFDVVKSVDEFLWLQEDPVFLAGRVSHAIERYMESVTPPFFGKLVRYSTEREYSYHTPGHAGGKAFQKSVVGRMFFEFYGPNLLRSDFSVGAPEVLGSLLDHSGPMGEAERYCARIFGADFSMFVLNGTSTSNQIVGHSCVTPGDVALADRNCHKSINYSLLVTGAIPTYMMPVRNGYGIIGPIPASSLTKEAIAASIKANPLVKDGARSIDATYAVVTNSTYDGLCYNAVRVTELLKESTPRLHFDEAWYGYAKFNPLYARRFGMSRDIQGDDLPTIYATQSTHKLLAALSQASMVHVRSEDRAPVAWDRFNEAYMMHGSTSPCYPMIGSCDVSTGMMDVSGLALTAEAISEAVHFRKAMVSRAHGFASEEGESWFFGVWQPDEIKDPVSGKMTPFSEMPIETLCEDPACWVLRPGAKWHGFDELEDDYCMLDPIKMTVTTPGIDAQGNMQKFGIPAGLVTSYLLNKDIDREKTGDYVVLFLFSMGMTPGGWGTLINGLMSFKHDHDTNAPLEQTIPSLPQQFPERYKGMGLRDLAEEMHAFMLKAQTAKVLDQAFSTLPEPAMAPAAAYTALVRGHVEKVKVEDMEGRVPAVMIVPYPPGIPLMMPGEKAGKKNGPLLQYLLALQEFDLRFPGFEHDTHGVEPNADGKYEILCLTEEAFK